LGAFPARGTPLRLPPSRMVQSCRRSLWGRALDQLKLIRISQIWGITGRALVKLKLDRISLTLRHLLALGQAAFFGKQPVVAFYGPGRAAFFSNQPAVVLSGRNCAASLSIAPFGRLYCAPAPETGLFGAPRGPNPAPASSYRRGRYCGGTLRVPSNPLRCSIPPLRGAPARLKTGLLLPEAAAFTVRRACVTSLS
jgi:hypothetical protein